MNKRPHFRSRRACKITSTAGIRFSYSPDHTWVGGERLAPADLPLGRNRYPLYRRLGGPHCCSRRVREISPQKGIDPLAVQHIHNESGKGTYFLYTMKSATAAIKCYLPAVTSKPNIPTSNVITCTVSLIWFL